MKAGRGAASWGLAAAVVLGATAARGPMWADSSKLTVYALASYLPSLNPGDHAGWTALARLWLTLTPFLPPVRSLHLLSALAGAAAVALAFALVRLRTADTARAHSVAALLLVAHPLWWAATATETYAPALALALAAGLLACGTSRGPGALAAGVAAGWAVAAHAFSLVVLVPFLPALRRRELPAAAGALLGSAPVWLALLLPVPPDPLTGHLAGGSESWAWHLGAFVRQGRAAQGLAVTAGLLAFGLGPVGLSSLLLARRRHLPAAVPGVLAPLALLAYAALLSLYAPFRLHLMVLFLLATAVVAVAPALPLPWRVAHVVIQTTAYLLAPILATAVGRPDLGQRRLPGRVNASHFLSPVRVLDDGPSRYAASLLQSAPPGAVVLADFNPGAVLALEAHRQGAGRGVEIVPTAVDDALGTPDPAAGLAARILQARGSGRPVLLADTWEPYYRLAELGSRFGIRTRPCGPGALVEPP